MPHDNLDFQLVNKLTTTSYSLRKFEEKKGEKCSDCSWTGECLSQDIRQIEDPRGGGGEIRGSAGGDDGASW
jgi:hypothetical protein